LFAKSAAVLKTMFPDLRCSRALISRLLTNHARYAVMLELIANYRRLMGLRMNLRLWNNLIRDFRGDSDIRGGSRVIEIHWIRSRIAHISKRLKK
jgi:hypothetical protein